jgi:hypothetical protein
MYIHVSNKGLIICCRCTGENVVTREGGHVTLFLNFLSSRVYAIYMPVMYTKELEVSILAIYIKMY